MSCERVFEGKVAIVTGTIRGIGAAITERFTAEGANDVIIARTLEYGGSQKGSLQMSIRSAELLTGRIARSVPLLKELCAATKRQDGEELLMNFNLSNK